MPYELAVPARPLLAQPLPTHRVLDLGRDCAPTSATTTLVPARVAIGATALWLVDNPCAPGGQEEMVLTDPFDYAAEDRLIDAWLTATAAPARRRVRDRTRLRARVQRSGRPAPHQRGVRRVTDPPPPRRHQDRRPLDRAHRAVRGRAAGRPGRRRREGRTTGLRRHRPLRRRLGQRPERAGADVQPGQAFARARRPPARRPRHPAAARAHRRRRRAELPARRRRTPRHRLRRRAGRQRTGRVRVALGLRPDRSVRGQGRVRHRDPGVRRHSPRTRPTRQTGEPHFLNQTVADKVTALYAAQAITAALFARERTRRRCARAARDARRGGVVPVGRRGRQRGAAGRRPLATVELRVELPAVPLPRRLGHLHADVRRRFRRHVPVRSASTATTTRASRPSANASQHRELTREIMDRCYAAATTDDDGRRDRRARGTTTSRAASCSRRPSSRPTRTPGRSGSSRIRCIPPRGACASRATPPSSARYAHPSAAPPRCSASTPTRSSPSSASPPASPPSAPPTSPANPPDLELA